MKDRLSTNLTKNLILDYGVKNLTNIDLEDENTGFNTKLYGRNYFIKATYILFTGANTRSAAAWKCRHEFSEGERIAWAAWFDELDL